MKSMVFKIVGNVHIVIHGTTEPRDEDWHLYVGAVRSEEQKMKDFAKIRTLVFCAGGGPTAKHRKEINEFLGGRTTPRRHRDVEHDHAWGRHCFAVVQPYRARVLTR